MPDDRIRHILIQALRAAGLGVAECRDGGLVLATKADFEQLKQADECPQPKTL